MLHLAQLRRKMAITEGQELYAIHRKFDQRLRDSHEEH